MTYSEVWDDENLTIEAKAIYGFLCTYAGTGSTAYPSVDIMCQKLHVSRARFYNHMNLLLGAGYVKKNMIYSDGVRVNNVYELVPNSLKTKNLQLDNVTVDNVTVDNLTVDNLTGNNKNINNKSTNNKNIKSITSSEPDKSTQSPSGILLPLNDNTYYDVPMEKISIWEQAYKAVDVKQELQKMCAWLTSNPTKRKTKRGVDRFINTWLSKEQDRGGTYRTGTYQNENRQQDAETAERRRRAMEFDWPVHEPRPDDPFQ